VDSDLTFRGATSNSPAKVVLAPAFEGKFAFRTSYSSKALVEEDEKVEDPSGAGRKRQVRLQRTRLSGVTGTVGWGDHVGQSSAEFTTSNSRITLVL